MKNGHGGYKKRYETHTSKPERYDPNNLLTGMIKVLKLKNDAALSRTLEVAPPVISKIRHGKLPVGASLLIRMQEISNMSIRELRKMMGDRRNKFRISDKQFKPRDTRENSSTAPAGKA